MATVCFAATSAHADDWTFDPFIGSSEQFTDNVNSTTSGEESDFVTTIDLGFDLIGETRRTELDISYKFSQDYYAEHSELNGYRQNLIANGNIEILDDHFYVDGRLTFTEENLGSTGSTSAGDRTQSGGRTQVFNGNISPYYVQDFGTWATAVARYGYSETRFLEADVGDDGAPPADQRTNEFQINLESGIHFSDYKWAWDNSILSSESDVGESFVHILSMGTAEFPINRLFSLIGTLGYDDFDADDIDDSEVSGLFGGAGIRFHPSSRTDVSFQIGYRFGDVVYDADLSYSPTSQDTITGSYVVSVQSADQSLANTDLLDAEGELIQPEFSSTTYVDDVTKTKALRLSWTGSRGRNDYGLSTSFIDREVLSTDSTDRVVSIDGNFDRQLTPRANLAFNAGFSDVVDGQTVSEEENVTRFGTTYVYEFGNGLIGTAAYDFLERQNATSGDITENSFTISIKKTF
ncbi:MAG: TIGR03016 family PEP-CTERM system-associated outer membrane protein [Sneathiella sp.]|nr:TIGR03016 family PEP-CTERM system-associated outer membrane protein [Sneathiella sp.]